MRVTRSWQLWINRPSLITRGPSIILVQHGLETLWLTADCVISRTAK